LYAITRPDRVRQPAVENLVDPGGHC